MAPVSAPEEASQDAAEHRSGEAALEPAERPHHHRVLHLVDVLVATDRLGDLRPDVAEHRPGDAGGAPHDGSTYHRCPGSRKPCLRQAAGQPPGYPRAQAVATATTRDVPKFHFSFSLKAFHEIRPLR